jgi:hypothetical protein
MTGRAAASVDVLLSERCRRDPADWWRWWWRIARRRRRTLLRAAEQEIEKTLRLRALRRRNAHSRAQQHGEHGREKPGQLDVTPHSHCTTTVRRCVVPQGFSGRDYPRFDGGTARWVGRPFRVTADTPVRPLA